MNYYHYFSYSLGILMIFCWPTVTYSKIISSSEIPSEIDRQCNSIGILPYFMIKGDYYVALYKNQHTNEYADIEGKREHDEKNSAQTAARIFFPLQQHKNIRTGSIDWCSAHYIATMVFKGPWSRSYLLSMGNDRYMYMVDVKRASSLKKSLLHPLIMVKIEDLLNAINSARVNDNFTGIQVLDLEDNLCGVPEQFARGLARGENWNFLKNISCEVCK